MLNRRSQNRRKNTRFSIDIDGFYYFREQWEKCRIYDLNLDGAGLRLKQCFMKSDIIKLKFGTETEQNVFNAVVVNVNGPRIGIQFKDIDDFDREFLRKIINNYSKRYKIK